MKTLNLQQSILLAQQQTNLQRINTGLVKQNEKRIIKIKSRIKFNEK